MTSNALRLWFLLLLPLAAQATTHTVPGDFSTIQSALWACADGDTVSVAPGFYFEPLEWPDTESIKMIAEGDTTDTVIDGLQTFRPLLFATLAGTTIDTTTQVIGFKITGGGTVVNGGGLLIVGDSPYFRDCAISDNSCEDTGGGLRCESGAAPVFEACDFRHNNALFGGGVGHNGSSPVFRDCRFLGNQAQRSGGGANNFNDSDASYIGCLFENNAAYTTEGDAASGGGLRTSTDSDVWIEDCVFRGNTALFTLPEGDDGYGGAISNNTGSTITVIDCLFEENSTGLLGGAIFSFETAMSATGCEFHNNSAGRGAGIFLNTAPPATIIDCWFEGNEATYGAAIAGEADTTTIIDCTIIGNTGEDWAAVDLGLEVRMEGTVIANNVSTGGTETLHSSILGFYDGRLEMSNCTVAYNTCETGMDSLSSAIHFEGAVPDVASLFMENCIVYANTADVQYDCAQLTDHAFSCTLLDDGAGGGWDGCLSGQGGVDGNMGGDPLFCNPGNGDFHLLDSSPALAANNDCGVDMGAWGAGCVSVEETLRPADFGLLEAYPNPFNPTTRVRFVTTGGPATLAVYNLRGERVTVLHEGPLAAGTHQQLLDGSALASGLYFLRLEHTGGIQTRRVMLVK